MIKFELNEHKLTILYICDAVKDILQTVQSIADNSYTFPVSHAMQLQRLPKYHKWSQVIQTVQNISK